MTKQHFIALASRLRAQMPVARRLLRADLAHAQWLADCSAVAAACAEGNPRFDRDRFLAACGVEGV